MGYLRQRSARLLIRALAVALASASVIGCTGQATTVTDVGTFKGLKYTVISKNVALADGNTDLTMEVLVQDMLGNLMPNYTPTLNYSKNSGINYSTCTPANQQGVATCVFRSILDGSVELTIGANTKTEITFTPADLRDLRLTAILPSFDPGSEMEISALDNRGLASTTTAIISSSVGNIVDKPKQRTADTIFYTDNAIRQ